VFALLPHPALSLGAREQEEEEYGLRFEIEM
jgi:hypothetical protein